MTSTTPAGRWWRFGKYEIRDGWIRPAPKARLGEFDAWDAYWHQPEGRVTEPPYVHLVNLVQELPVPAGDGRSVPLEAETERKLLSWCSRNGLLGVLPEVALQVTTAMPWKPAAHEPRTRCFHMVRRCDEWERSEVIDDVDRVEREQPLDWPQSQVLIDHLGGDKARFEPLATTWADFFPDVPREECENYDYPRPLSPEFWQQYGEPVRDFLKAAIYFAEAVTRMTSPDAKDFRSAFGAQVNASQARSRLNKLARSSSPFLVAEENGSFQQSWRSPSLIGMLAMMAQQDLLGERRLYRCPCGKIVSSSYPDTKYCSPQHRDKFRKRAQRERNRGRASGSRKARSTRAR